MSWVLTTIGEHCTVTSSKRFHLSDRSESGVPFYCSKQIIQRNLGEEVTDFDYIQEEFYLEVARRFGVPQANDLLVTTRGTIGIPYLYRGDDRFYFADGNLTWMKDFKETLIPQYLYYWFLTQEGQKKIDAIAKGTAQKAVPIAGIKLLEISLPPINTQRKISNILSSYDKLIANNQKQIKLLEEAAQRLYKEWFVDLRFPGYKNTPVVDGVPEGWFSSTVSDFGDIVTGKTPSTSNSGYYGGKIPFVKIPDMHNTVYPVTTEVLLTKEGADTQKNKYIPRNSLMVSCIATVGLVNIAVQECQTNQQINSIILHNETDLYFLYFTLRQMTALLDGVGSNGATMTNVNKTKFGKIAVVCPTEELRKDFFDWCAPVFQKIEALSYNIAYLKEARDTLLPKLMNGEIEV